VLRQFTIEAKGWTSEPGLCSGGAII
jgi:hypothetical protein